VQTNFEATYRLNLTKAQYADFNLTVREMDSASGQVDIHSLSLERIVDLDAGTTRRPGNGVSFVEQLLTERLFWFGLDGSLGEQIVFELAKAEVVS
jgi:hypothetical protein